MTHIAFREMEEVPIFISRSSVNFEGHMNGKNSRSYQIPQICLTFKDAILKIMDILTVIPKWTWSLF